MVPDSVDSVARVNELNDEEVQVADSGTITLPCVGTVPVAEMGVPAAEHALDQRNAEYFRAPEVHIATQTERSQTVPVMGLVNKPELVPLTRPNETIIDVTGAAGWLTDNAAQRVLFVPAEKRRGGHARRDAGMHLAAFGIFFGGYESRLDCGRSSWRHRAGLSRSVDARGRTIIVPPVGNVMVGVGSSVRARSRSRRESRCMAQSQQPVERSSARTQKS